MTEVMQGRETGKHSKLTFSEENYRRAFITEKLCMYPSIDSYERHCGFAINELKLLNAARVLACPIKVNPPNWQHGRVLYSTLMRNLLGAEMPWLVYDIGTAKGFSALCMLWALQDTKFTSENWEIHSVDVIDPNARIRRNTVAEVDGPLTLHEILAHWKESARISFHMANSTEWLRTNSKRRVNFAFLDGKHNYATVKEELVLLGAMQKPGDMIVLDDLQVPGVMQAVLECRTYVIEQLPASGRRIYGLATRR